ncbi:hypothetical protein KBA73_02345 [Patescibacteria group bacterium]|nr:hypothetical protein [Patescibacteria group bacterium]
MTKEELTTRLTALGANPNDIDLVIEDVNKIVAARLFLRLHPLATAPLLEKMKEMTAQQMEAYFKEHPEDLVGITNTTKDEIEQGVWTQYFEVMEKEKEAVKV